ncbi:MAG: glycosyltransferase family 4 protein [Actinomycetota bacterium]
MTRRRRLLVWSDATAAAGAEEAAATLVAHLGPEVGVTVAGCRREIVDLIAGDRPSTDRLLVPRLAAKGDIANGPGIRRLLGRIGPDAIHLNKTEVADLRYVELAAIAAGPARVISVVHHVERPATASARALTRWLAARAAATVAVGPSLARQLESILDLPLGRVVSIPNALPVLADGSQRPPAGLRSRLTVGVLARFVPHKAVDHVIAAVAALDDVRLLIGGEGPERERLERLIDRLGVDRRVELLGWVPPDQVLDHCDVLVSAARIEGHPLALLDARRRGIPVVAADVGAVGEIVEHERTGLLVAADDVTGLCAAIERLADDAGLRASMAAASVAAAAAATPHGMVEAYERLYWPSPRPLNAPSRRGPATIGP